MEAQKTREVGYYWVRYGRFPEDEEVVFEWTISFWNGKHWIVHFWDGDKEIYRFGSSFWSDGCFDYISKERINPPADEEENGLIKFSMDGYRSLLSENVKELRDIVESIVTDGYDMAPSDLIEAMNNVIRKSNAINCVWSDGCDSFSDMSDIKVELIDC